MHIILKMDIFRLCITLLLFAIVECRRECAHRDLGNEKILCVCNMTFCDDLDPITHQTPGMVSVFETNKRGDRFKETKLKFDHSSNHHSNQTITIDRTHKLQEMIGFGGAFTDATGYNLEPLPKNLAENIIKDYFSPNGIEYTTMRVPMAGADFSPRPYTYDDHKDDIHLTHFNLTEEDIKYKIPYMQMANKISTHKIKYFACPWTAPGWMKTSGQIAHGGELIGPVGGQYYQMYADYHVKFLNAYKKHNLEFWAITPTNEPVSGGPRSIINSMRMKPEEQRDFIKTNLGPTLAKAGYGTEKLKIMIFDDNRGVIAQWANVILSDKEAAKYASGIAYHWYQKGHMDLLDKVHQSHPNYFLMATEACEDFGHPNHSRMGEWSYAETYAWDIISDLQHWTSGWVEWNLALDAKTLGPNWSHLYAWAPILVNASVHEYYKLPQFYAIGHFSKFITPGSVRIQLNQSSHIRNFETLAFARNDKSIVVIAFNANDHPITLTIDDPKLGKITQIISAHAIQSYIWWE